MALSDLNLPSLAGAAAAFSSVYAAFAKFDADQSESNRKFVRDWLLGLRTDNGLWAYFFVELFSRAFGKRHLSAECVRRSAGLTTIVYAVVWSQIIWERSGSEAFAAAKMAILWIIPTIVADYFSLWKTRFLLTREKLLTVGTTAIFTVIADALVTLVILVSVLSVFGAITKPEEFLATFWFVLGLLSQTFFGLTNDPGGASEVRMIAFASLLTSAWVWVYLFVAYLLRALNYLPASLQHLSKILDVEHHPVRSIGYVAATVSATFVGTLSFLA